MPARKEHDARGHLMPTTRRGFGHVRQLPSGKWQASYKGPDGNRYKGEKTFSSKVSANGWLATIENDIERETWRPPHVLNAELLRPYALKWLEARRNRKGKPLAPATRALYLDQIERGMADLHSTRLTQITTAVVREWHNGRVKVGASQAGHEAALLRAILNTAVADEILMKNPVRAEFCNTKTGRKIRPPSDAELALLIEAIKPKFKAAIVLAAFGGPRKGEWLGLKRKELPLVGDRYVIDIDGQTQYLPGQGWNERETKSEDGVRRNALPAWATPIITDHLREFVGTSPDDYLFPPNKPGAMVLGEWERAWKAARKKVGVAPDERGYTVRLHDLRHYYGTKLADAGVGLKQIQAAGGWGTPSAALKYLHSVRGADAEMADLLAQPTA